MKTVATAPHVSPVIARGDSMRSRRLWVLLGLAVAVFFGFFVLYPTLLPAVGVNYFGVWFLDSFAILASNDALARGLDVYAANPLDYLQRPHVYSHWWLELGKLGLTRADNFRVGLVLVLAFFAVALAGLRPRQPRELLWYLAVLCSSPVLLAVHRANNDLVIFLLLAPVVPCLLSLRWSFRLLGVLLIGFATALKFYPVGAALVLLAGQETRLVRRGLGLAAVVFVLLAIGLRSDFARLATMLPYAKAEGLMTFGAGNLLGLFGAKGWLTIAAGSGLAILTAALFWRSRLWVEWKPASDEATWLYFVLGAALLATCFFTGMNFAYRWVFALWLAPFLWRCWHDGSAPVRVRKFAALTAGLLLLALWADPFAAAVLTRCAGRVTGPTLVRWADGFFLAEQPFTWAFFGCLLGWLVLFLRESPRMVFSRE